MKNTILKDHAKEAKKRMKMLRKDNPLSSYHTNALSKEELALYEKVSKMLSSERIITNPINELIDKEYYSQLSIDGKQRYIMYLSDKYIKLKERYYQQNIQIVS